MNQSLATSNDKYLHETGILKQRIEVNFLKLGERLLKIKGEKLYEPNYEDFNDYLDDIKLDYNAALKMMSVYEKLVVGFGVDENKIVHAGVNNVYEALPYIGSKKQAHDLIHLASTLRRADYRLELAEKRTGVPTKTCKHEDSYLIRVCRNCPHKERVYEENKSI